MTGAGTPVARAALVHRLQEISDYFPRYRRRRGSWACDRHYRVTHYGKLAYRLVIDGFLFEETGRREYLDRGLAMLAELAGQLRQVDDHWIFYPGLLNPQNASNNAIDSGAIVDSLTDWWRRCGEQTPGELRRFIRDSCLKVASTYLPHTLGKPTNQALWAMTGLAGAWRHLEPREGFREACVRCLERSFADQNADGSFPYLPARMRGADHPALHDASGYYHSRHLVFIADVARKIDYDLSAAQLRALHRGADFLCALYGPDGSKSLEVEAKHWYWLAPDGFETASAGFDLSALATAAGMFEDPGHRRCLAYAARNFVRAAGAEGEVRNLGGRGAFQCPHFWSAHAAWVARALADGGEIEAGETGPRPGTFDGRDSGVVTMTTGDWHLQARRRRPPTSPLFGSYAAGSLWALYHRGDGFRTNLMPRRRFSFQAPGELFLWPTSGLRARAHHALGFLRRERRDYRFTLALVRDALRVGAVGRASRVLWTVFARQNRFLLGSAQSSFWGLDAELEARDDGLEIECDFARPDGSGDGVRVRKSYRLHPDRVETSFAVVGAPAGSRFLFVSSPAVRGLELTGARRLRGRRGLWFVPVAEVVGLRFEIAPTSPADRSLPRTPRGRPPRSDPR